MNPKVTIIMATYNREQFIAETLVAIQNQTYQDWECLIVDDGGSDTTKEVIGDFLAQDSRFQYLKRTENYKKGLSGCRNNGLDLAKGEYIIFFDDDDVPHPQNLELCVKELQDSSISFCRYERNTFSGNFHYQFDFSKAYTSFYIDKKDILKVVNNQLQFNSTSIMWKKICFEANRFVETLQYAEDWELYSRIVSSGFRGISINKCLFYGRKHPQSNTGEYYNNNPIRRTSQAEAVLLVAQNLKEKQLLTYSLKRFLLAYSIDFKEYNLFQKILFTLELPTFEQLKWQLFYAFLPIRLWLYRIWKMKSILKKF